jgi:hypothetical protein
MMLIGEGVFLVLIALIAVCSMLLITRKGGKR